MSIVFKPKIANHLRKSEGRHRVDGFSKEEIAEVIQLRARGTSYTAVSYTHLTLPTTPYV